MVKELGGGGEREKKRREFVQWINKWIEDLKNVFLCVQIISNYL